MLLVVMRIDRKLTMKFEINEIKFDILENKFLIYFSFSLLFKSFSSSFVILFSRLEVIKMSWKWERLKEWAMAQFCVFLLRIRIDFDLFFSIYDFEKIFYLDRVVTRRCILQSYLLDPKTNQKPRVRQPCACMRMHAKIINSLKVKF